MYSEFKAKAFKDLNDSEWEEELTWLESMDLLNLISYIDSLFDIIIGLWTEEALTLVKSKLDEALKVEAKKGKYDLSTDLNEYEKMVTKLEGEVRQHISI